MEVPKGKAHPWLLVALEVRDIDLNQGGLFEGIAKARESILRAVVPVDT